MDFARLDNAMATCKAHLDATGARGTEIESYLVSYLLVTITAEFEQRLEAMVVKRAERTNDPHVHSFVKSAADKMIRAIKISEISGILGHFGPDYKQAFSDAVLNTPVQVAYDMILTNRHGIAHKSGTQVTFADLEREFPESKKVLESAATALGLTAVEIASL